MITIHGVPLSVHTRKAIVTAILKKIDYRFEVVIPVIPDNPPANWSMLSPTGLIPVMQDGDFTLPDSSAICQYMEKTQPMSRASPMRQRVSYPSASARRSTADSVIPSVLATARTPRPGSRSSTSSPSAPAPDPLITRAG